MLLETLVLSLSGLVLSMPVLLHALSHVSVSSYSSGPARQDVAAGRGKAPYGHRGIGPPVFRTVPRHRGGDRSTTVL